jgi:hypothetical protein
MEIKMIIRDKSTNWNAYLLRFLLLLLIIYCVLLIPSSDPSVPKNLVGSPFVWNQDERWEAIEIRFSEARKEGCNKLKEKLNKSFESCERLIAQISLGEYDVRDPLFDVLEENIFSLGPMVAVCPDRLRSYMHLVASLRVAIKNQSMHWNLDLTATKNRLYRLIYGSRQALEEVMLQVPRDTSLFDIMSYEEPSVTPFTIIFGVKVHSGDILVSRGGVPTSALIARGSDYPGNFSHVALAHVDSRKVSIIEAHIEKGVTVSTLKEYLQDKKLRIMVLRLRSDLAALKADPMLPHAVATKMLENVKSRHIAYDFAMDVFDSSKMFCSEVASSPYRQSGITLWKGISAISSKGASSWLSAFGVKNFKTQEPSDLEYDPQLSVVAEWRDWETLFKDHVDNSVIDAMLEGAELGEQLKYDWYMLPIARVVKVYSQMLNLIGLVGPIPEGMDATAALKNKSLTYRHTLIKTGVLKRASDFQIAYGYIPPYWDLLKFSQQIAGYSK